METSKENNDRTASELQNKKDKASSNYKTKPIVNPYYKYIKAQK